MANLISCPHCAKQVSPTLDNCPYCGGFLTASGEAKPAAPPRQETQACPNCNAAVQPGDIICVACGTNLLTGQKIAAEAPAAKKQSGMSDMLHAVDWRVVGFSVAAVLVVIVIGLAGWLLTRDPVARARSLAEQGKLSEATEVLSRYVSANPDDVRGHFELGRLMWQRQRYSEAADALTEAFSLNPEERSAAMMAVAALDAAGGATARTRQVQLLEAVLDGHPDDAQAWYLLALARGAEGNAAGQAEALENAQANGLAEDTASKTEGVALAMQGNLEGALRSLRSALTMNPDSAATKGALGFVLLLQGNQDEGAALLQDVQAAGETPLSPQINLQLGLAALAQRDYARAEARLRTALESRPNDEAARFFMAAALEAQGLQPEALAEYEQLSRQGNELADEAAVQVARIYLDVGEPDRAAEAVERAEGHGADGAIFHTVRGRIYMANGAPSDAQAEFRQALQSDGAYAPAYLENGLAYVQRQSFVEAVRSLERYVNYVDPELPGARVEQIQTLIEQLRQTTGEDVRDQRIAAEM